MTDQVDQLPDGECVCGRDIPADSPSDWACSEPCQSAWLHHQANPEYPHPREIRENAEARAAAGRLARPPFPGRPDPAPIADGTEVNTDHGLFVRVGNSWQPAGAWIPLAGRAELTAAVAYQRWCPQCRARRDSQIEANMAGPAEGRRWDFQQQQTCLTCEHVWAGRPLVGVIETRGEPWPALRLRLTDGYRSVSLTLSDRHLTQPDDQVLNRQHPVWWQRLERQLGGGICDADEPSIGQLERAGRARRRQWDVPSGHGQVTR